MRWVKMIAVLMLTWATSASVANVNPSANDILDYMDYLNGNYQQVNVVPSVDPGDDAQIRPRMWHELQVLEHVVKNGAQVPDGSLVTVACVRAACGGKPGPCHTCQAR
jgi:hypothetical protein